MTSTSFGDATCSTQCSAAPVSLSSSAIIKAWPRGELCWAVVEGICQCVVLVSTLRRVFIHECIYDMHWHACVGKFTCVCVREYRYILCKVMQDGGGFCLINWHWLSISTLQPWTEPKITAQVDPTWKTLHILSLHCGVDWLCFVRTSLEMLGINILGRNKNKNLCATKLFPFKGIKLFKRSNIHNHLTVRCHATCVQ